MALKTLAQGVLTVTSTAAGLPTTATPPNIQAVSVFFQHEAGGAIRISANGTTPVADGSNGEPLIRRGGRFNVHGAEDIRRFQAVAVGVDASVRYIVSGLGGD